MMTRLRMWRVAAAGLIGAAWAGTPAIGEPIASYHVEGVAYDASVPLPEDTFRHGVGERPIRHERYVDYLTLLADTSERITAETIGYSHQGRPLLLFTVTSPANHARIDELRAAHLGRLTGAREANPEAPAVIWLHFGVHGTEPSGMDAAVPTLYHLAAAQGAAIEQTLSDAVIMVLAVYNPDGNALRAQHVEAFSGVVPVGDPAHFAHQFRTARMNHYWFDLNRQWLWASQPESKAIIDAWRRWKPYVSADFHEMGPNRTFYFHPGEPRRLNPMIPDAARELNKTLALSHVEWLDSEQRLYYSGEGFDNFYFGKGSTYPMVNGGIGILVEAGSARAGVIESASGGRAYADNVRMSFRIALTTIAGALANRDAIEAYQRDFFRTARADGASADTRAYVFTTAGDTARLNRFLEFLLRHEIVTHRLARAVTVGERTYEPGRAFIVPTDQDQYRLIELMFERLTEFEENIYYDVSAWNVPLAFDLDYDALAAGRGAAAFNPGLLGAALEAAPTPAHAPPSPDGAYGYVFPWSEYYAPRALYRLLSEGVRVRIATKPATAPTADGGAPLVRGSVFVPLARQDVERARIEAIVADIAQEDGVAVLAATSGYTPEEGVDLGGPSFHPLDEAPSVLLLFDDGLSHYQAGEVWHLLDVGMHMPVTLRPKRDLGRLDLARYTHLVLVGGDDPSLEDEMTEALLDWVRRGGTLIATNEAAAWVQTALADRAEDEAGAADDEGAARDAEADAETDAPVRYDWADFERRETEHEINGALFAADLDTSHPLGFGYADRFLPTFRTGTHVLAHPQDNPFATPAAYLDADDLLLSGYASPERLEQAAGAPLAIAEREGAGAVVLIADSPDFRGAFPAMNKLFMNAIFFSSLIEEPDGEYDFD